MKSTIDCVHCYLKQAVSCMNAAGADPDRQHEILYELMDYVKTFDREASPAENSSKIALRAYEMMGVKDPYKEAKRQSNELAMALVSRLKEILEQSQDRLLDALKISVAGNIIDLGIQRSFDIDEGLRHSLENGFSINHYDRFVRRLNEVEEILFLGDNSGEIVFDRILVEELNRLGKRVVFVVKEGPVLNDATLEDAVYTGMDKVAEVMTNGTDYLGTCMSRISDGLRVRLDKAPLIISKGQANFESLEHLRDFDGRAFFMLKIKCEEVSKVSGARFGDVVFMTR